MESDKTLRDLGWSQILEAWSGHCATERGSAAVLAIGCAANAEEASERAKEVSEARILENRAAPMSFGGIVDIRESVVRAQKGSRLESDQLIAIGDCARGYDKLRESLEQQSEVLPLLWKRAEEIGEFQELVGRLFRTFEPDGRIADSASPALATLRRKVLRIQQQLEAKAKSLLEDSKIGQELQDKYWTQREERYVLPVKASSRSKVPGIVHGSSGSGQTIFVEPHALVELNNELKLAEFETLEEEERILAALTVLVGAQADSLQQSGALVVHLDRIGGAAKLATHLFAREPVFAEGRSIVLRNARHPLMLLSGKECIANDILIEDGKILIVSGPNAGGKTVTLKTTGLVILMARYGLHVVVGEESSIPWFNEVCSAIGDSQSLESELSTFSAHIVLLREFLTGADDKSLVLVDEICSATEPEQGGALAQAILESLSRKQVTALVTTHYEGLKALATEDDRFANASVGFDLERLAPTFHLHLGVPGASAAIDVARRMKLPEAVSLRAQELSGGGRTKLDELLRVVSDERTRLSDERAALSEERAATAMEYERITSERAREEENARKAHVRDYDDAITALRSARKELDVAKKGIRRRKVVDASSLSQHKSEIDRLSKSVTKHAPKRETPAGVAPTEQELSLGTKVYVSSLGGKGVVINAPRKGIVEVQVGLIKTRVQLADLRIVAGQKSGKGTGTNSDKKSGARSYQLTRKEPETSESESAHRSTDSTLDLRGQRAESAIDQVESFIDSGLLSSQETIFIIHGHGTGVLRQVVRTHLQGHPLVSKWRRGESGEGGDGVTVAWLRHS
ncbi:MAG: endonuclease MutS2 [Kofleriaceae bacterium]|nr:endonuclease MutS2 [Kofleriaceae bacterium]